MRWAFRAVITWPAATFRSQWFTPTEGWLSRPAAHLRGIPTGNGSAGRDGAGTQPAFRSVRDLDGISAQNGSGIQQRALEDSDGVALLEVRLIGIEAANQIGEAVMVHVERTRLAVRQALLGAGMPKSQGMHIHERGRVKRRAG